MTSQKEAKHSEENLFIGEKNGVLQDHSDDMGKKVDIVVRTWKLVKQDPLKHGTTFYKRLFSSYPEVIPLFSFSSELTKSKMEESDGLKRQALLLIQMIDAAVNGLDNLPQLTPKLQALGRRHFVKYRVKPEHFQPVGESLLWTLKEGLGEAFSAEVEAAWTTVVTIIADVMIKAGCAAMANSSK